MILIEIYIRYKSKFIIELGGCIIITDHLANRKEKYIFVLHSRIQNHMGILALAAYD